MPQIFLQSFRDNEDHGAGLGCVCVCVCSLSVLVREGSNFSQLIKPMHENCEKAQGLFLVLTLLFRVGS